MKKILKGIVQAISLACAFPFALLSLFGRIEPLYLIGAECFALLPGLPGDYVRIAYYRLTLEKCALESRIQFGSFFAHPRAAVGRDVYIGGYCVLGCTSIGDRTHLASGVQILSGRHQHGRDSVGNLLGANQSAFETVLIGSDCWIGAGAIVMAAGALAAVPLHVVFSMAAITVAVFGFGLWAANMMSVCADAFPPDQVGSVTGLSGVGAGIGGMVYTLLVGRMVDRFGYAPVFVVSGALPLVAAALLYGLLDRRLPAPA